MVMRRMGSSDPWNAASAPEGPTNAGGPEGPRTALGGEEESPRPGGPMPTPPSHRTSVAFFAALTAVIGIVAGCARSEPRSSSPEAQASTAGASFDPCSLLTKEEVEAVAGWSVAKATPYVTGDRGHCVYQGEKGNAGLPPEEVDAGVISCWFNFPCGSDMPHVFASSEALAAYRAKLYEGNSYNLDPQITPLDDVGVPALMHELATLYTMEMWLGDRRLAYVSVWDSDAGARTLGQSLLARAR